MRALTSCFAAAIAVGYAYSAAACESPAAVPVPDGKTSTMEQMLAGQAKVKAYQTAMTEFLACIDGEAAAQGETAPEEFKSLMVARHNAAVAEMEGVAAAFNDQIKAYRAANPPAATN
jgi:hypothetical protein